MSIEDQTHKRQVQLFRQVSSFYETGAGVKVQRVAGSHVLRVLKPYIQARMAEDAAGRDPGRVNPGSFLTAQSDLLSRTILTMDRHFSRCTAKQVDMLSSAEAIAEIQWEHGAKGCAALLLAWVIDRPTQRPKCVGALTCCRLYERDDLGTSANIVHDGDLHILRPHFRPAPLFIDGVCSIHRGAGSALILNAVKWALTKQHTAVMAQSFSAQALKAGSEPESKRLFARLGFETLIARGKFKVKRHHGAWVKLDLRSLHFTDTMRAGLAVCARRGLTARTANTLVNQC